MIAPGNAPAESSATLAADFPVPSDVRGLQGESSLDGFLSSRESTFAPIGPTAIVRRSERVRLSGWILDARTHRPGESMYVDIDGVQRIVGRYGMARPDVAAAFHDPRAAAAGFTLDFPASVLALGSHGVRLGVVDDGVRYESVRRFAIVVVP